MMVLQNIVMYIFLFLVEILVLGKIYEGRIYQISIQSFKFVLLKFIAFLPLLSFVSMFYSEMFIGKHWIQYVTLFFTLLTLIMLIRFFVMAREVDRENKMKLILIGLGEILLVILLRGWYERISFYFYLILTLGFLGLFLYEKKGRLQFKGDTGARFMLYLFSLMVIFYGLLFQGRIHLAERYFLELIIMFFLFFSFVSEILFKSMNLGRGYAKEGEKRYRELMEASEKINAIYYFDQLTGLYNKISFQDFMEKFDFGGEFAASLLIMDIDNFKDINNLYGISEGDNVLRHFGQYLKKASGIEDFTYRFGGDQFGIFHKGDRKEAERFAHHLIEEIAKEEWYFKRYNLGISLGVTEILRGKSYEVVYKEAELALSAAKKSGKRTFRMFEPGMMDRYEGDHYLESLIKKRLAEDDFELYCQPKSWISKPNISGGELLLRMKDEKGAFIPMDALISVAEKTSLIEDIDRKVLKRGVDFIKSLEEEGFFVPISLNVSSKYFVRPDFIALLSEYVKETGIHAENLIIEITENSLIENIEWGKQQVLHLKDMGIRVSLDDFGTGYSSISYLANLPVSEVKIDKGVIENLKLNEKNRIFLKKISEFLREIKLDFVLEGIETEEQLNLIQKCCGEGKYQGYYFYRPMAQKQFLELLRRQRKGN